MSKIKPSARKKILSKYNNVCFICNKPNDKLEMHHTKGKHIPEANKQSNLLPLCRHCHKLLNILISYRFTGKLQWKWITKYMRLSEEYLKYTPTYTPK